MPAARLGAWLRHTGERWAKAAFAEKLAVLLALGAVLYTIVTGVAERSEEHTSELQSPC